jgi:hypothetical protein
VGRWQLRVKKGKDRSEETAAEEGTVRKTSGILIVYANAYVVDPTVPSGFIIQSYSSI